MLTVKLLIKYIHWELSSIKLLGSPRWGSTHNIIISQTIQCMFNSSQSCLKVTFVNMN